jgi:DNA recombination protein RmuC
MDSVLSILNLALLVAVVIILLILARKAARTDASVLASHFEAFEKAQERTERAVREEVADNREELGKSAREQRLELTESLKTLGDSAIQRMTEFAGLQQKQLEAFSDRLSSFARVNSEQLDGLRTESATAAKQLREEVISALNSIAETTTKTMAEMANIQKAQLEAVSSAVGKLSESNEKRLEALRATLEAKLESIQNDNAKQLDQMRQTVDEKLQGTLEKRLDESFRQVSERLEQVHKGLGEMQTLATGVGDLKKVLTNVKTRGTWGEVQLGAMLEQILNPDQFAANVGTKEGGERVEFAIKLPGQGTNKDETLWLPIDAKFPIEDYQRLIEAQERADAEAAETAGKQLEIRVKACARDISEKYLNPPKTTDFGILFLPIEGLFAEVIRRSGLTEAIQREYRVVIAGPTTLWSILNSLQMGFRTLAIQERSSEVWNLLSAVKTEWTKYGAVLDAVQNKLNQATETIEKAKVRSRAIGRKLNTVQELPAGEAAETLSLNAPEEGGENAEDGANE